MIPFGFAQGSSEFVEERRAFCTQFVAKHQAATLDRNANDGNF